MIRLALALVMMTTPAWAADMGSDVRAFFKSLTQPGSTASCCDLSDCRMVDSEWRDGQWWALAVVKGWIAVPADKVIRNKPNIMEKAILCTSPGDQTLYCFLPQDFGT